MTGSHVQNAGHVGEGWRPDSLRSLSSGSSTNIHILTIDYRGFGRSTGDPSEAGLIADGIAAVNWAIDVAKIPPSRIVLLGQSLGTAVASAVALHFASGPVTPETLLPPSNSNDDDKAIMITRPSAPVDFAGIVLVAPFTTLPHLVLTYRIKGVLPILSPLRPYPYLQNLLSQYIVDKWDTSARLAELVRITAGETAKRRLRLQILHARDDAEIGWKQGEALFQAAIEAEAQRGLARDEHARRTGYTPKMLKKGEGCVEIYRSSDDGRGPDGDGDREIRLDVVGHGGKCLIPMISHSCWIACSDAFLFFSGSISAFISSFHHHMLIFISPGHNQLVSYAPVSLAMLRAFGI